MKTAIFVVLLLSLFLFLACAQQQEVPVKVAQANVVSSASVQATGLDDIPQPPRPLGIVEDDVVN